MHFVKKVPTSEEEKAAKKKEHEKRAQQFLHVRDRIVTKREKGEYDDEILSLTQLILEKNADIYTFWNIRRTAIELKIAENVENSGKNEQKIENLLAGELFLSYECIKSNPKSYSAWYQRAWVLQRQKQPDFEKELALCQKALQMDCRNFHCWDHRRIVARMAKRTEEQELEFSNKLIEDNFSNYSAWHYRSIALRNLQKSAKLDDSTISTELQKVKNAFYMDADDQSAWTYTRWLLENGSGKEFLRPDSATTISLISASFHPNNTNTTLVFSRTVTLPFLLTFVDTQDESTEKWKAYSSTSASPTSARVWQYLSDAPLKILKPDSDAEWLTISENEPFFDRQKLDLIYDISEVAEPAYVGELVADCQQLIELEPNNKWPIYMLTLVLLEFRPIRCHSQIVENLKKLAENLDPKRKNLYKSLISRQNLNFCVREQFANILENRRELTVRYSEISSLEGVEFLAGLVESADFSGNLLEHLERIVLPNLQSLTVNENPIESLHPSPSLARLQFLSIASTKIANVEMVSQFTQKTPSLNRLVFCETPLVAKTEELRQLVHGVKLIQHWM